MPSKKGKKERIENKSKDKYLLQSYQGGYVKESSPTGIFTHRKSPLVHFPCRKTPLLKFPHDELPHGVFPQGKFPRGKLPFILSSNYFE